MSVSTVSRTLRSPFDPPLPAPGRVQRWGRLYGSGVGLVVAGAARRHEGATVVLAPDQSTAERLEQSLRFYVDGGLPLLILPDRETLPYDVFSPHQDIVSERLDALRRLPALRRGVIIVPVPTAMVRLSPREYLDAYGLHLAVGERMGIDDMRRQLEHSGYRHVSQVMEHGEYCVRGSLFDLFPMGSDRPYRIDLLDDEIDSIRTFDPETQLSIKQVETIHLMPAREFPLHQEAIDRFRQGFRREFPGDPQRSPLYRDVSDGLAPAGIEYYLPLFFERTMTLFDYLPRDSLVLALEGVDDAATQFWAEIAERYEQGRHDYERPLLPPETVFVAPDEIGRGLAACRLARLQAFATGEERADEVDFALRAPPRLAAPPASRQPFGPFREFIDGFDGRALLVVETPGRRETLIELLREATGSVPPELSGWSAFVAGDERLAIAVAGLDEGVLIDAPSLAVIAETQIFGEYVMQRRRRAKRRERDADAIIRNLTELAVGAPVVHEEHGVGRYLGLQTLTAGGMTTEFLKLEYAGGDKLYVPVSSLHLISRYAGAAPEQAPLHRLGSGQWQKARSKAAERARDVAAELLDVYARRQARRGRTFPAPDDQYAAFAAGFPFEETPDQLEAIQDVVADLVAERPMDRLVCGDVGFGKTEVAMRAAFVAVQAGAQVAVLVPTTLLAQQHYRNFRDRFADFPVRIEVLSRFRSGREQGKLMERKLPVNPTVRP